MRVLNDVELKAVSGGDGEREEPTDMIQNGLDACEGYPDSQTVTLSLENSGSLGLGLSAGMSETIEFTMTCGDVREAAESQTGGGGG